MAIVNNKQKVVTFVNDVHIWANVDPDGTNHSDVGIIPDGKVSIKFTPILATDIGGESYILGYDCSWEISALQVYDLRQFQHFNNQRVWLCFNPAQIKLANVILNITAEITGKAGESTITISGTKRVEEITDVLRGDSSLNGGFGGVWGNKWSAPWAGGGSPGSGVYLISQNEDPFL